METSFIRRSETKGGVELPHSETKERLSSPRTLPERIPINSWVVGILGWKVGFPLETLGKEKGGVHVAVLKVTLSSPLTSPGRIPIRSWAV